MKIGWGFILEYKLDSNISRPLIIKLYKKIDVQTLKMEFAGGWIIALTADAVHSALGLPNGIIKAPRPSEAGDTFALLWLKKKLGLGERDTTTVQHLTRHIKKGAMDKFTMKCIILVICTKLICLGLNSHISREVGVVKSLDIENSGKMDFCQLVIDEIKRAAIKFHVDDMNQSVAEGCAVLPLIIYLDSLKYLNKLDLLAVLKADVIDKERWGRLNVSILLDFILLHLKNYSSKSNI